MRSHRALPALALACALVACSSKSKSTGSGASVAPLTAHATGKSVFLIVLENTNWSAVKGSADAPYINGTLLAKFAHAEQYFNPPGLHPSEPNYVWLEAGDNLNIKSNENPPKNRFGAADHLTSLLETAGKSWKAYQEGISGNDCPIENTGKYAVRHNPYMFFDDVTDGVDRAGPHCVQHVRPYTELPADLAHDTVPDYGFITPNLCHDGHDACGSSTVRQLDEFLSDAVPLFLASKTFDRGSVLIVTWDEGSSMGKGKVSDGPIGLMVIAKNAKPGYGNDVHYDHSSTLKTTQELLGVTPLLRHAADADTQDFADLFTAFP